MLTEQQIRELAARLDEAERNCVQTPPLTAAYPDLDMDDAYAVQSAWLALKHARGASLSGYKVGLTSRAMQEAMGIDTPDYGVLLTEMAVANGASLVAASYLDPRIEAEFAFVLDKPLFGETVSRTDVLDATAYVVPALELIAARSWRQDPKTGRPRTVFDTIADNAAAAAYVAGDVRVSADELDLAWAGALVACNGEVLETGLGGAVMGHPAEGIRWLCRRFARHGVGLQPGQFLLSGSFTRPVAVSAGDQVIADYGPLGQIRVQFE